MAQDHPQASDRGPGTAARPFKTIAPAAEAAQPGDTVRVHAGVYRERVAPARGGEEGKPIVYQAAAGERVCVRGSDVFKPKWRPVPGQDSVFTAALDDKLFRGGPNVFHLSFRGYERHARPFEAARKQAEAEAAQHANPKRRQITYVLEPVRGMVFVDGQALTQALRREDVLALPGTYFVPPGGGELVVHFPPSRPALPPTKRLVEITTRSRVFAPAKRGLGHIHVDGFVLEHAANMHPTPQYGMVSTRTGHHWVIRNCTIRYAATIGLDVGSEWGIDRTPESDGMAALRHDDSAPPLPVGHHLICDNVISDNGLGGICGLKHWGTRIIGNVFERNNRLGFRTWEVGALKVHQFFDGLIEGNLFRDNDCFGIWLDNQYKGSRVTRNVVLGSYIAGVMVELGLGPVLVDNNIIACTRNGDGVYSHDASGVTIAHNLIYGNANWGVYFAVGTDRKTRDGNLVHSSRNRVVGNMILANKVGAVSLPLGWERAVDNESDHNLLMGGGEVMDESTGVEQVMFMANTSHKHVPMETILAKLSAALDRAGVPAEDRPNLKLLADYHHLTLDQWRLLTGFDRNSRCTRLYHEVIASYAPSFVMNVADATPWETPCPPVPGVDRDFHGRAMPRDYRLPGPFQDLAPGANRILLWPVRPVGSPLPKRPAPPPTAEAVAVERKDFSSTGI